MERATGRIPMDVEATIKSIGQGDDRAEAALILASIANRATAALHQLARAEANARKGQPNWGRWASLTNASRDAVLRTATCRQTAGQLAQGAPSSAEAAPPGADVSEHPRLPDAG